jgi:molybdopterin converting factor small subunit
MTKISVQLPKSLKGMTHSLELNCSSLQEILTHLKVQRGDILKELFMDGGTARLRKCYVVFINGKLFRGEDTSLTDGDRIQIKTAIAGG